MFSLPAPGIGQDHAVQKTVIGLEYKGAEAQRDANPGVVAPLLAESFVNTDADGQVYGKAQLLSNLKGGKWEQNGISDVKVAVYGDTAVATGAWAGKGGDGEGTGGMWGQPEDFNENARRSPNAGGAAVNVSVWLFRRRDGPLRRCPGLKA